MKNWINSGRIWNLLNSTANTINPGDVVVFATGAAGVGFIGVSVSTIAPGLTGSVDVAGLYKLSALSTDTFTQGQAIFWDAANLRLTVTSAGNTFAGRAATPKAAGVTSANCLINGNGY